MLAPGFALILEESRHARYYLLAGVGYALVIWNLMLISQVYCGLLPATAGAEPGTLLANAYALMQSAPLTLLFLLPALITSGILLIGVSVAQLDVQTDS